MSIVEKAMEKKLDDPAKSSTTHSTRHAGTKPLPGSGDEAVEDAPVIGAEAPRDVAIRPAATHSLAESGPAIDIDFDRLRAEGLWPPEASIKQNADQYRRIKRPLLKAAFGRGPVRVEQGNVIMIGSSLPGEGKSFTTFNLAASIAQEVDHTVLLVDADVAKPHITRALNLTDRPGLIDGLLDEQLDLQDLIVRTNMPRLRVIPAGPVHRQATELLASDRMARLVNEMASRYPDRLIIFDTPPLIATTEAQVMAALMGQVLMVVNAGKTPQQAVMQALESLDHSRPISLILNKVRQAWGEEYGSYAYYGYQ